MYEGGIGFVSGIEVGHVTNAEARTGCTVVLCREGAVGGVDVRGSAPGTRETDLLRPGNLVERVHGILLSGGSAFGLDAAGGVMEYLENKGVGFDTGVAKVPIVSGAVLFDLAVAAPGIRPDKKMGYEACLNTRSGEIAQGSVGAGTGATVGKVLGMQHAMKGGIGSAGIALAGGVYVAALIAVNAFGDVLDPITGQIIAGAREPKEGRFLNTHAYLLSGQEGQGFSGGNTTIGVIATNASLTREQANKLASIAHDGLAMTIRPVHTMMDGDTLFAMATGKREGDFHSICAAAVEVSTRAVINAVKSANLL